MTADSLYVLLVLAITIAVFVSDRLRLDVAAILATLALVLGGQIDAGQAVAGLGDTVVVLIAALFVVGEALFRTGVAHSVGGLLLRRAGSGETRLVALMMIAVAALSAFMSSTGAVAVFIPIALGLANRTGIARERLLMPLAVAAMIGGMLTLIGTPPNLVVSGELSRVGMAPFSFFSFTPLGLVVLAAGIVYMAVIGVRLLARRDAAPAEPAKLTVRELFDAHQLTGEFFRLRVTAASPLVGAALRQSRLQSRYNVTVAAIRDRNGYHPALLDRAFAIDDVVFATGSEHDVARLVSTEGLEVEPLPEAVEPKARQSIGVVEVLVSPLSQIVGQTVVQAGLREAYGLTVLSLMRSGDRVRTPFRELNVEGGDVLLLSGSWASIRRLGRERPNLFVLRLPAEAEDVAPNRAKAPIALAITAVMMAALAFNLVPSVIAVLIAALAMVLTGCLDMNAAYRAINWQSLVLIAFMLPMATALEQSGALAVIVDALVANVGTQGPMVLLAVLFALTSVLSQFISNTATTVLIAPVAVSAGTMLDVSPYTLLMGVAIAASTAFATPVASPVNTLVLGPGRYRFMDFVKVGVPLQLIALVLSLIALPVLFPF